MLALYSDKEQYSERRSNEIYIIDIFIPEKKSFSASQRHLLSLYFWIKRWRLGGDAEKNVTEWQDVFSKTLFPVLKYLTLWNLEWALEVFYVSLIFPLEFSQMFVDFFALLYLESHWKLNILLK